MVKRGRGRGRCSGAGRLTTRIVSQDGLRISTRVDKDSITDNFDVDDNLDFEPEERNNECAEDIPEDLSNYLSDQSTLLFQGSVRDVDRESKAETDNQSILSAYRGEMISFSRTYAQDNREQLYMNIAPSLASTKTILDSSSSNSSTSSESSSSGSSNSCTISSSGSSGGDEAFSKSNNGSDYLEETGDDAEENYTKPVFKNKKVVVTDTRNITITLSRPSKRKWNKAFQSDPSAVVLLLEDIGYTPQTGNSDSGSECSTLSPTNSGHTRSTLKVTLDPNSGRTCQQVGSTDISRSPDAQRCDIQKSPDFQRSPDSPRSSGAGRSPIHSRTASSIRSDDQISAILNLSPRSYKSDDLNFKMPLPPAKRPPSRPRRSDTSSIPSSCQSNSSNGTDIGSIRINRSISNARAIDSVRNCLSQTSKDDDTISLVASTIGITDNLENNDNFNLDLQDPDDIKDEFFSHTDSIEPENLIGDIEREYIEKWISNIEVGTPAPHLKESPSVQPIIRPPMKETPFAVERLPFSEERSPIQMNAVPTRDGSFRIDFRKIPRFFSGLCFHHFFATGCNKSTCSLSHTIATDTFTDRCKQVTSSELSDYYGLALRFHSLLKEIYGCFLEGFAFHKMESKLIATISDYLSPSLVATIDAIEALRNIIRALEKTGLSFLETIEKISFNVGFMNYPILANILLEIISQKPNLSEYWEEMKRISRVCGQIPPNIVENILYRVTSVCPLDKNLCTDIYNFIVRDKRTDISKVRRDLLHPFETFVNFGQREPPAESLSDHIDVHLSRERQRFEKIAAPVAAPNDRSSVTSDERYFVPNNGGQLGGAGVRRLSAASSSPSSSRSSLGIHALGSEIPALPDFSRYVPETTVRRIVTQQVTTPMTSSSCPNLYVTLFPKKPILGTTRYRSDFTFNVSLHNLLPECFEKISMHERDIIKLNEAIKHRDGNMFLMLLDNYKNPVTVENFITMTIAHLNNLEESYHDIIMDLLKSIEQFGPDYIENNSCIIKGIFEVIVFNLLFTIERKGQWREGRKLLEHFCDWDSLISSQRYSQKMISPMGRYIFLAKLFVQSNGFGSAFEILQCPSLHLLEAPDKWPFFGSPYGDMESRNNVLGDFFTTAFRYDVVVVSALYEKIFKTGGLYGYDAEGNFNPMLITLINDEKISSLKRFASELFYMHMDFQILKAFTMLMADEIKLDEAFTLYEFGCRRNMYVRYTGRESRISIRTNMSDSEITLILKYYFRKFAESELHPYQIYIDIKLPEGPLPAIPVILKHSARSIVNVNCSIRKVLRECFRVATTTTDANSTEIEVNTNDIIEWY